MQFIETIYKILKPGGIWINLGPLLYHFSDMPMEDSIEPSYDVVRDVIQGFGFQLEVFISSLMDRVGLAHRGIALPSIGRRCPRAE